MLFRSDRGVGEQEERLGDEGQERGHGQAEDLAVDGLHRPSLGNRASGPSGARIAKQAPRAE